MKKTIIGVDIGGTTVKIGFVTQNGDIITKWEIPTNIVDNGKNIIEEVWTSIKNELENNKITKEEILGVGIGAPGFIDDSTGFVYSAVNIGWNNFALAQEFKKISQLPVFAANDANVAALGENWKGAGQQANNLLAITLGTGVGGGVIVNGNIISGENGTAGEIGHITVDTDGDACNCGRIGCLETVTSATGIVRQAKKKISENPNSELTKYYSASNKDLTAKDIFERAKVGDILCIEIIEHTTDVLGFVIANVATVINPSKILIGGGVAAAGQDFIAQIENKFKKYALERISSICVVTSAKLGNDAGLIGAASLVKKHIQK